MSDGNGRRFAIYYAPPDDHPLTQLAAAWLGWNALSATIPPRPPLNGLSPETWRGVTESPRTYGFHATLKPPFRLPDPAFENELKESLRRFASERRPFTSPRLRLASIGSFLALILSGRSLELEDLATAAVREFDRFRTPPSTEELERRRKGHLNARQLELLNQWGYPYVFDEWRFHMTLTGSLAPGLREDVELMLQPRFQPHCLQPFLVDSVCLFEQPDRDAAFRCVMRAPFQ